MSLPVVPVYLVCLGCVCVLAVLLGSHDITGSEAHPTLPFSWQVCILLDGGASTLFSRLIDFGRGG